MLFNSFPFLFLFLPVVVVAYYLLPVQAWRLALVVGASYVFYAYAAWWYPILMAASTVVSYVGALAVTRSRNRRLTVGLTVAALLVLLGAFKYAAFVGGGSVSVLGSLLGQGFPSAHTFLNQIALPIGISFYTFEGISYVVDVHRGDQEVERNPLRYAFFISFFPHLIAGPIVRSRDPPAAAPRTAAASTRTPCAAASCSSRRADARRRVVADALAHRADRVSRAAEHELGLFDLVGRCDRVTAFQIYFDFCGLLGHGASASRACSGIELPWNFDRPYRAPSPTDFWRRWHMTLSTWLRDYLYIPLGGNRKGETRRDANLMATMGLGGLWHGASLNFAIWGLYQGFLLLVTHRLKRLGLNVPRAVAVLITFVVVMFGWVFFRLHSAHDIGTTIAAMVGLHGLRRRARAPDPADPHRLRVALVDERGARVEARPVRRPAGRGRRRALRDRDCVHLHEPRVHLLPLLMRRLILFLAVTGVLLAALGAFNWWLDPYGSFWKPAALTEAARTNCLLSEELVGNTYLDFKRAVIASRPTQVFVTGSSRTVKIAARPGETTFANAGIPNVTPAMLAQLFRSVPRSSPVRTVYIGVEAFWFNPTFKGGPKLDWYSNLKYVLGASAFRSSEQLVRAHPWLLTKRWRRVEINGRCVVGRADVGIAWRPDGSRVYGSELAPQLYHPAPILFSSNLADFDLGYYDGWTELSKPALRQFTAALDVAKARGWRVVGFTVPNPTRYIDFMKTDPGIAPRWREFQSTMRGLMQARGFGWLDLSDVRDVPCGQHAFVDGGFHPDGTCSAAIRRRLDAFAATR